MTFPTGAEEPLPALEAPWGEVRPAAETDVLPASEPSRTLWLESDS
jgi:hypothetical protein